MKKAGKRLLILAIIGVILYGAYFFLARPTGFTDRRALVESYFTNIASSSVCSDHFNPETVSYCESYSALYDGQTVTIDSLTQTATTVNVTISINGNTDTSVVTFITEPLTGIRGFLHNQYYLIDDIQ